jgi:phage-related protein
MDTFTFTPCYTSSGAAAPRIRSAQFDDGFESAEPDGRNTDLRVWTLEFTAQVSGNLLAIDEFLQTQGGAKRFLWTPPSPMDAVQRKVVCEDWQWTHQRGSTCDIHAVFMERP